MTKKTLGVMGGMGPMATSIFLERLISNTVAEKDQDHIDTVIFNHATLPDRTTVIAEKKEQVFLDAIKEDIKLLELIGVSNIAIPCNTSHYFFDEIQQMTNINIINMIEETTKFIKNNFGVNNKIGILATNGTIKNNIYENQFKKHQMNLIKPDEASQQLVMDTIYNIKADGNTDSAPVENIIYNLINKQGCVGIILGCTELSFLDLDPKLKKYCIDPMNVLVERSIQLSGKKVVCSNHAALKAL